MQGREILTDLMEEAELGKNTSSPCVILSSLLGMDWIFSSKGARSRSGEYRDTYHVHQVLYMIQYRDTVALRRCSLDAAPIVASNL
jgi:hypothetical protein